MSDKQELLNACVAKLQEAGESVEKAVGKCMHHINKGSDEIELGKDRIVYRTGSKIKKGVIFSLIILLLLVLGAILIKSFL